MASMRPSAPIPRPCLKHRDGLGIEHLTGWHSPGLDRQAGLFAQVNHVDQGPDLRTDVRERPCALIEGGGIEKAAYPDEMHSGDTQRARLAGGVEVAARQVVQRSLRQASRMASTSPCAVGSKWAAA